MKKILLSVLLLLMSMSMLACIEDIEEGELITVIDMVGDEVTLRENPQKVAVIARAAADMMIGFGLGDVVDGMFQTVLDNAWTELIYPGVNDFHSYGYNESAELFLSRGVDLVLAPEKHIAEALRAAGVTAITVNLYGNPRYDSVMFAVADLIAQIWPRTQSDVNYWKTELNNAIEAIESVLDENENGTPKSIYYVRGDRDRGIGYTDTKGALVETIYEDIFKLRYLGSGFASNRPSIEDIMLENPDIIVAGGVYQNKIISDIFNTEPQKLISAVVNENVYNIPIGFVMWEQNSMVLPLFIYDQANKLYPELFDFDMLTITKDSFMRYFNIDLTDDEVAYMLSGKGPTGEFLAT